MTSSHHKAYLLVCSSIPDPPVLYLKFNCPITIPSHGLNRYREVYWNSIINEKRSAGFVTLDRVYIFIGGFSQLVWNIGIICSFSDKTNLLMTGLLPVSTSCMHSLQQITNYMTCQRYNQRMTNFPSTQCLPRMNDRRSLILLCTMPAEREREKKWNQPLCIVQCLSLMENGIAM